MLWKISAIRQNEQISIDVNAVINGESDVEIREFFGAFKVIILSIEQYNEETEWSFGDFFGTILYNEKQYRIVTQHPSAQEIAEQLISLWIPIETVNSISQPLTKEQSTQIIESIKTSIQAKQDAVQQKMQAKEDAHTKKFADEKVKKILWIAEQTITDMQQLWDKAAWHVSWTDLDRLKQLQGDLRKVRMGTNSEKITDVLEDIFMLMEKIEINYLDDIKESEYSIVKDSFVSNVDITGEYGKYKKAQQVLKAWTAKSKDDNYYVFFGKIGLYQKFLWKELLPRIKNLFALLQTIHTVIEYSAIMLAIRIWLFMLYQEKVLLLDISDRWYLYLVHVGSFWVILSLLYLLLHKKNILILFLELVIIIIGYIFLFNFFSINFAL